MTVTDASIKRDLRTIINLWPGLQAPAKDGRGGSGAGKGVPVSGEALTIMREVPEALVPWVRVCMEDFDADPSGVNMRDGAAVAAWLVAWSRLLAKHVAGEEYGAEVAQHAERVERCVAGAKVRKHRVGACVEKVDLGGAIVLCPGELVAYVRADGEEPSVVRCTVNGKHEWAEDAWGELNRRVNPGGVKLDTVQVAAALTSVPAGTVRRWVHEGRVVKHPTSQPRFYYVDTFQVAAVRDLLAKESA